MYPDKTYTRKGSISILRYSTLYTRPTLHCRIHSVNPVTYRGGFLQKDGKYFFLLVMYGFCSNKGLYLARISFKHLFGLRQQNGGPRKIGSVHPSLCPSVFLKLDHQIFLNYGMVQESQLTLCVTEPDFYRKTSFAPSLRKTCQNWTRICLLLNSLKKLAFNFY